MLHRRALFGSAVLLALTAGPARVLAQATPGATPSPAATLLTVPPDRLGEAPLHLGFVRTVYQPEAGQTLMAGAAPVATWLEQGELQAVIAADSSVSLLTPPAEVTPLTTDTALLAGQGLLLAPGSRAELRNAGVTPAVTYDLLVTADAPAPAPGVTARVVARQPEIMAPGATLELRLATLEPGIPYAVPAGAVDFTFAPVDPRNSALITGGHISRAPRPIDVYVVLLMAADAVATPAP